MIIPLIVAVSLLSACPVSSEFAAVHPGDAGSLRLNFHKEYASSSKKDPLIRFNDEYEVLAKRDNGWTVPVDALSVDGIFYLVDVSIGTPPQGLQLGLDTGSSDAWILSSDVDLCDGQSDLIASASAGAAAQATGCVGGLFDSSSSSTFIGNDSVIFNISYGDGSGASGIYATDVFSIGGAQLDNFTFGLANSSTSTQGILGIGYRGLEASGENEDPSYYSNLPQALTNAGVIQAPVYSLFLNSINSTAGTVLFGGYDPSRIDGPIQNLPFVRSSDSSDITHFYIGLIGFGITSDGESQMITSDNFAVPALLDSGTTLSYLPTDIVKTLVDAYGAAYSEESGVFFVDCEQRNQNVTFDYYFDGITIRVESTQAIIPYYGPDGTPVEVNGTEICLFGFYPSDDDIILGDAFLRSAYVIYDLTNNEAGLAQAAYPSDTESSADIQTIGSSGVLSADAASTTYTARSTGGSDTVEASSTITDEPDVIPTQTEVSSLSESLVSSAAVIGSSQSASATTTGSQSQKNLSTKDAGDIKGHATVAIMASGMIAAFFVIVL